MMVLNVLQIDRTSDGVMAEGEAETGDGMLAVHHSPLVKREVDHQDITQVCNPNHNHIYIYNLLKN